MNIYPIVIGGIKYSKEDLRQHFISVAKYYKGEQECPYTDNTNEHKKALFWDLERMYIANCLHDLDFNSSYIHSVEEYIKTHKSEKNMLTSPNVHIEQKAMIWYIQDMLMKWTPQDTDIIFEY